MCHFRPKNQKSNRSNFYYIAPKMTPKTPFFGSKIRNFQNFQNFFSSWPKAYRDNPKLIKKIFCPINYIDSRTEKRFSPF